MKKIAVIALIIFVALIAFIIIRLSIKLENARDQIQIQNVQIAAVNDSVLTYKNKSGELIAKVESVQIEKDNLKEALEAAGFDKKQLREDNIKLRNLNLALKAEIVAAGNASTTVTDTFRIVDTDTIYFQRINDWTNNYLSIFNGSIENKNLNFDYTYKTGISLFQETKRKQTIITAKLTDPQATITKSNSITIINKKKWYERPVVWGIAGTITGILIAK